jgi:hypothetical protein
MSDGFIVNNPGLQEANDELNKAVGVAGTIIDDLNAVLARMASATQNSAIPLWVDLQNKWNGDYQTMVTVLEAGHKASVDAHDWYLGGDLQSVRIMS